QARMLVGRCCGSRLSWDPRSLQIIVVLPEELSAIRKQSLSLHNCNKAFPREMCVLLCNEHELSQV
uniref:Uncharacterized protein n=1 Tax=Pundamilia nyererei TaxID=303518 RepID=A0A3B4GUN9_9CICH